jgi:hypothetical protein
MSERTDRDDTADRMTSGMTTAAETGDAAPPPDADRAADPRLPGRAEAPEPSEPERRAPRVGAARAAATHGARRPPNALGPFITGGGQ